MIRDRGDWPDPRKPKAVLMQEIEARLEAVPGNALARSDLGVKICGDDLDQLLESGNDIARVLAGMEGAESVKVEQVAGLPALSVARIARRSIAMA